MAPLTTNANLFPNALPQTPSSELDLSNGAYLPRTSSQIEPIAICGMAVRLPGGIMSTSQFWDFLISKKDARDRIPKSRFNIDSYHSKDGRPGFIRSQYGYFL